MDLTQHDLSTLDFEAVHALISDIYEQLLILKVCVITNIPVTYFPPALPFSSPLSFCCRLLCRMVCVVFFFFFFGKFSLSCDLELRAWLNEVLVTIKLSEYRWRVWDFFFFFKHLCIWEIWLKGNNSYFDKYQFCLALHNEFSFVCSALCVDFCCRIFWENSYLFSLCWCVFGFDL